jgi:hypothetical protein
MGLLQSDGSVRMAVVIQLLAKVSVSFFPVGDR